MGRTHRWLGGWGSAAVVWAACGSAAQAGVESINGILVDARNFDDYPASTLAITDQFPALLGVHEQDFGAGGFANRHRLLFTDDGATRFEFDNQTPFDITTTVTLDAGSPAGKEAGFYFDKFGEPRLIVKGNGEVAAFDGAFPFFSFGQVYTLGTAAELRVIYTPGSGADFVVPATIEYVFNGLSSGRLEFSNLENGMLDGTVGGFYAQFAPDDSNPSDFGDVSFADIRIAVPGPGSAAVLGLACVAGAGRRRRGSA